ncbi:MAG: HEAT repeat domain-containing protein, partial [Deltaproteobacteria bacterium]|nr:HEAT repeat domain-containing protein [Deltaproteobacteria bacterium]
MRARWLVALAPIAIAAPRIAHAQEDVSALIKLVDEQPAGMDRAAWKEKRREAARKLVASGDKRAVPVLMKVAASETFDIIGETAIEGLGTLGDPQAVPTLQQIEADPSRDAGQRTLARKALAKLGAKPSAAVAPGGGGGGGS